MSSVSPVLQSPAQAVAAYRGREGSFDSRYQSPLDDFRVSQEPLLDHMDAQNRRCIQGGAKNHHEVSDMLTVGLCPLFRMLRRTRVGGENRV